MLKFFPVAFGGCVVVACSAVSPSAPNADPVQRGRQTNLSKLYADSCAKCHGEGGEGGGGGTKSIVSERKMDQSLDKPWFDAIKNGVPDAGMEAYGGTLTDPEIWGLVVHMREIQADSMRKQGMKPLETDGVFASRTHKYRVETVIDRSAGLETPWAIDWLPDGRMLVTNRPGKLALWDKGNLTWVENVPPSVEIGQGGLMDVTVHPGYKRNGWIYLGLTDPAQSGRGGMTKIVRGKLAFADGKTTWTNQETIFENDQSTYNTSGVHFGNRIVFDGKGHIFFSIGERGNGSLSQDLSKPNGKIFRVNEDGSIPKDNPFLNTPGAMPAIWSYGHRNPQGLVIDANGDLWDTEHGPRGGDEVNLIKKGANYGWPIVAWSINYSDAPLSTPWATEGKPIEQPVYRWIPSIGACGMDLMRGSAFPSWKGDIIAGGLSGQNVDRFKMRNGKMVEREELIYKMGRVRETVCGPDGYIYVALNQPDKVIRLVPAK